MTFSEQTASRYDLALMDLREENGQLCSRLIWRRYTALLQIPLVADNVGDTSAGLDKMRAKQEALPDHYQDQLNQLLEALAKRGVFAMENTAGYALKSNESKKSIYTQIVIQEEGWSIVRHQVRTPEPLFNTLERGDEPEPLHGLNYKVSPKESTLEGGKLFNLEIAPEPSTSIDSLTKAIAATGKLPDQN